MEIINLSEDEDSETPKQIERQQEEKYYNEFIRQILFPIDNDGKVRFCNWEEICNKTKKMKLITLVRKKKQQRTLPRMVKSILPLLWRIQTDKFKWL